MNRYVADTHALLWHLYGSPKLSPTVKAIFERVDAGEDKVFDLLRAGADNYRVAALEIDVAQAVQQVDRAVVPELPDRIIAATALHLGLPLICHDRQIESLPGLITVW